MAKLLYVGTYGTDSPTKASMPFITAGGAAEAGHEPMIALLLENTTVMKDVIADNIVGVGFPPLKEIMAGVIANKTPIYV